MIREIEMSYNLICAAQIISERFVVCDTCEQDKSLGVDVSRVSLFKNGLGRVVFYSREEDVLLLAVFALSAA